MGKHEQAETPSEGPRKTTYSAAEHKYHNELPQYEVVQFIADMFDQIFTAFAPADESHPELLVIGFRDDDNEQELRICFTEGSWNNVQELVHKQIIARNLLSGTSNN